MQQQAQQAKETASRAKQEVDNSLNIISELKNKLQQVQSNEVDVSYHSLWLIVYDSL